MRQAGDRAWARTMLAANAPVVLRAGLVKGDTGAGMLAPGQVVGMTDDLPSRAELLGGITAELRSTHAAVTG